MKYFSRQFLFVIVLAFGAAQAVAEQTPYGDSVVDLKLHKVPNAPVYYVLGKSGIPDSSNEGMTSNAGFVVTEKGVVVYDTLGTPALGYRLMQKVRSVTDKPIVLVVAGHYHADHIYGLQAFREHTDAVIWAQQESSLYIDAPDAQVRLKQRRQALFPWVDKSTFIVKPDKTFEQSHMLDMGDTKVELIHAGPAHSPDDTIMVVHGYGVVFSGDLIFGGRLPFLAGESVNTKNWLQGLEYLQTLKPEPKFVVPGHGKADSDPARSIAFTRDYIKFLRDNMGKAVEELTMFDTAYNDVDWSKYKNVPTFKQANRGNAYQVFLEMESEAF